MNPPANEDLYVNEGYIPRDDAIDGSEGFTLSDSYVVPSPALATSPVTVVVISQNHSPSNRQPLSPNRPIDFGDEDYAFVDPKVLVTNPMPRSHSTSSLRTCTENALQPTQLHQSRRSMVDIMFNTVEQERSEVYTYIETHVNWALARKHTPLKVSSSEMEEPVYQNDDEDDEYI